MKPGAGRERDPGNELCPGDAKTGRGSHTERGKLRISHSQQEWAAGPGSLPWPSPRRTTGWSSVRGRAGAGPEVMVAWPAGLQEGGGVLVSPWRRTPVPGDATPPRQGTEPRPPTGTSARSGRSSSSTSACPSSPPTPSSSSGRPRPAIRCVSSALPRTPQGARAGWGDRTPECSLGSWCRPFSGLL